MKKKTIYGLGVLTALAAAAAARRAELPARVRKFVTFHPLPPAVNRELPRIACVGDSITYGDGVRETRKQRGYPALLEGLFAGRFQVLNYGLNGRTLLADGNRPYTREPFYTLAKRSGAECFLLMLGTNDTKPFNWDAEAFEPELELFIRSFQELPNRPRVYVMKPPCCFPLREGEPVAYEIDGGLIRDQVGPAVCRAAERTGAGVIDLYEPTSGHPEYFDDGVHPNYRGNREIARIIYERLTADAEKG